MTVNNKSKSRSDSSAAEDWCPSEQQENARALASLGGTEPLLQLIRRRRSEIIQSMLNRVILRGSTVVNDCCNTWR
jgi:hypothetical protein